MQRAEPDHEPGRSDGGARLLCFRVGDEIAAGVVGAAVSGFVEDHPVDAVLAEGAGLDDDFPPGVGVEVDQLQAYAVGIGFAHQRGHTVGQARAAAQRVTERDAGQREPPL